jgi:hypothetical protein
MRHLALTGFSGRRPSLAEIAEKAVENGRKPYKKPWGALT